MLASGAETNLYTTPAAAGGEGYDGRLTPQLLTRLLVAQNEAFTVLAGSKIAPLHAEVERLKEQYLRIVNDYADAGAWLYAGRACGCVCQDLMYECV